MRKSYEATTQEEVGAVIMQIIAVLIALVRLNNKHKQHNESKEKMDYPYGLTRHNSDNRSLHARRGRAMGI